MALLVTCVAFSSLALLPLRGSAGPPRQLSAKVSLHGDAEILDEIGTLWQRSVDKGPPQVGMPRRKQPEHTLRLMQDRNEMQQLVVGQEGRFEHMQQVVRDRGEEFPFGRLGRSWRRIPVQQPPDLVGFLEESFNSADPVDLVQVLAGTSSGADNDVSDGNTLPQIKMPWGFNDWVPQTDGSKGAWFFNRKDTFFEGMRCTHQPSPWVGDYGHFRLLPHIEKKPRRLTWSPEDAEFRPYFFNASLENSGFEFAPTSHAAIMRISPPKTGKAIYLSLLGCSGKFEIDASGRVVRGWSTTPPGDWSESKMGEFHMFFAVKALSSPFLPLDRRKGHLSKSEGFTLQFDSDKGAILVAVATSFISQEQAELNLEQEIGTKSFDEVVAEGKAKWTEHLSRIHIQSADTNQQAVFYTNFWKSMLFPRYLQEVTATGEEVHRSPYNGEVKKGKLVADSGFWDSYISVYHLQSLVSSKNLGSLIDGWVNAYEEAGWLPQWPSPQQHAIMQGTMGDVVLADAIAKSKWGLLDGFDVDKAYEAIRKDAFSEPEGLDRGLFGRKGLNRYIEKGYVADDGHAVSLTLDYYVADAAIARAAAALGHVQDAKILRARSKRYGVMFNKDHFLFQKPQDDGSFPKVFDPLSWNSDYTEGSAWQYRFYVPHDVDGLQRLYGGQLCGYVESMMNHTSGLAHDTGHWTMHEAKELDQIHGEFGYYAHNNQPAHHVLYVAKKAGCNDVADKYLRKVMQQLYTTRGWSGDEDNGEMSSWYVLSALGIFALEGAKDELVLGSPAVKHATVQLANDKVLTVEAQNQADKNVYVKSVTWTNANGLTRTIMNNVIKLTEIMQGGRLTFYMDASPNNAANKSQKSDANLPMKTGGAIHEDVQHLNEGVNEPSHTKKTDGRMHQDSEGDKESIQERVHQLPTGEKESSYTRHEPTGAPHGPKEVTTPLASLAVHPWFVNASRLILGVVLISVLVFVGMKYQARMNKHSMNYQADTSENHRAQSSYKEKTARKGHSQPI